MDSNTTKLEQVISLIKNSDQTIYKISKETNIRQSTLHNIVDGKSKTPHTRTLDKLLSYFIEKQPEEIYVSLDSINNEEIAQYVMDNFEEFKKLSNFNLWLDNKIKDDVIKILTERIN